MHVRHKKNSRCIPMKLSPFFNSRNQQARMIKRKLQMGIETHAFDSDCFMLLAALRHPNVRIFSIASIWWCIFWKKCYCQKGIRFDHPKIAAEMSFAGRLLLSVVCAFVFLFCSKEISLCRLFETN